MKQLALRHLVGLGAALGVLVLAAQSQTFTSAERAGATAFDVPRSTPISYLPFRVADPGLQLFGEGTAFTDEAQSDIILD